MHQLHPGAHPQLAEDVAQAEVDRARAEEELRGDVAVAEPLRHTLGDLHLLGRQLVQSARIAPASALPAGARLPLRAFGPQATPERFEGLERRSQMATGVPAPPRPAQELAERQLRPRAL